MHVIFLNLLFILKIILTSTEIAIAQPGAISLKSETLECLSTLQDFKIKQLGDWNIDELRSNLATLQIEWTADRFEDEVIRAGSKKFFVHKAEFSKITELHNMNVLLLHKGLLALGYDDRDYKISTGICWNSLKSTYTSQQQNTLLDLFPIKKIPVGMIIKTNNFTPQVKIGLLIRNYLLQKTKLDSFRASIIEPIIMNLQFEDPKELFVLHEKEDFFSLLYKKITANLDITPVQTQYQISDLENPLTRRSCLQNIVDRGILEKDSIQFVSLLNEISSVQVQVQSNIEEASGGIRMSAVNYPDLKRFFIKTPKVEELDMNWSVILLHESLEALGYDDANYEISTGLCWAAEQPNLTAEDLKRYLPSSLQRIDKPRSYPKYVWEKDPVSGSFQISSGGVTATGGGGDIFAADIKMSMLKLHRTLIELEKKGLLKPSTVIGHQELESALIKIKIEQFNTNADIFTIHTSISTEGQRIYWIPKGRFLKNSSGRLDRIIEILFFKLRDDLAKEKQKATYD